ncbi:DUF2651 family protein [Salibacterium sp. K-3]
MMNIIAQIVIVFPAASIAAGILGRLLFKNIYVMPAVVFITAFAAMIIWYNSTFAVWMIVYSVLAFLAGYLADLFIAVRTWMKSVKPRGMWK